MGSGEICTQLLDLVIDCDLNCEEILVKGVVASADMRLSSASFNRQSPEGIYLCVCEKKRLSDFIFLAIFPDMNVS